MSRSAFGARFRIGVTSVRDGASTRRALSWTVLRSTRRVPGLVAAVYDGNGAAVASAAVYAPSPRGVTFEDILAPSGGVSLARHATTLPSAAAASGNTSLPYVPSTGKATGGVVPPSAGLPPRLHLAVEFVEAYREHFGAVDFDDFDDAVFAPLSEGRGQADITSRVRLVERVPAADDDDDGENTEDNVQVRDVTMARLEPETYVRLEMPPPPPHGAPIPAAALRALDVVLATEVSAADVQIVATDGAGRVVFSWERGAEELVRRDSGVRSNSGNASSPVAFDDSALGFALRWPAAIQVPADGFASDRLRIAVRFNAGREVNETAANQPSSPSQGSNTDAPTTIGARPLADLLPVLEGNGAWIGDVEPFVVPHTPPGSDGTGRWALRARVDLPAKRVVALLPPQATLTVADALAALPALRRLVRSVEWRQVLDARRAPAEPHTSAFVLTVGLLLGAPLGGPSSPLGAALREDFDRTVAAVTADPPPTLWPEDVAERLLRLPDGTWSGAGHEAYHARELWAAEHALLRRHTSLDRDAAEYFAARAAVSVHLKALGRVTSSSATGENEAPPIAFVPLASAFRHADGRFALSEHLDFGRDHVARAAARNPQRGGAAVTTAAGSVVLATRREVRAGEPLTVDLTQGGRLSDLEVFARHGVVADRDNGRAALVNGTVVHATAAGAKGFFEHIRQSTAAASDDDASFRTARAALTARRAALTLAIARGTDDANAAKGAVRRRWRAVETLLHHEALAVRALLDELDTLAEAEGGDTGDL